MLRKKKTRAKKDKVIWVYVVKDRNKEFIDDSQTVPNIVSITATKSNALEFINKKLFLENESHFVLWCKFRGLPINDSNWNIYRKLCVKDNPYYTLKCKLNYSTIASTFRIFYGCTPIGCSFDTILETTNALLQMPKDALDEIDDTLKEKLENQKPN